MRVENQVKLWSCMTFQNKNNLKLVKMSIFGNIDEHVHKESVDRFGLKIPAKMMHLAGYFLEKNARHTTGKKMAFDLSSKVTYFHKDVILNPYVNIKG